MARPRLIITDPVSPQANRASLSTWPSGATPRTTPRPCTSSPPLQGSWPWGLARASPRAVSPIYAWEDPALIQSLPAHVARLACHSETTRDLAGATSGPWDGLPFPCHVTHPPVPSPSPRPRAVSPSGGGEVGERRVGRGLNRSGSSRQHSEEAQKTAISLLLLLPTRPGKSCEL